MQQLRDWLSGLHGVDVQHFIDARPIIRGPKQPPTLAKRIAHSIRMDFAFIIKTDDTTTRISMRCDINHTRVATSAKDCYRVARAVLLLLKGKEQQRGEQCEIH